MAARRTYLAIDLKSFYASVECVDRHLDPLTTNLVVADASRTEKTICLALTYPGGCKAESIQTIGQELERNARILGTKGSIFLPDFQHAETMTLEVEGKEPEVVHCPVDINGFEYSPLRTVRESFPSYGSSNSKLLFVTKSRLIVTSIYFC